MQKPGISIHIDKQQVFAPSSPMTGTQIRQLHEPPIENARDLFLKVPGPSDDRKIGDTDSLDLTPGMHFFSLPAQIDPGFVQ